MLKNEVDYRLAKWLLLNLQAGGLLTDNELRFALGKIAEYYIPPFLSIENLDGQLGDGVIVDER